MLVEFARVRVAASTTVYYLNQRFSLGTIEPHLLIILTLLGSPVPSPLT